MSFRRGMTLFQLCFWIPEAREMHWVNGQALSCTYRREWILSPMRSDVDNAKAAKAQRPGRRAHLPGGNPFHF